MQGSVLKNPDIEGSVLHVTCKWVTMSVQWTVTKILTAKLTMFSTTTTIMKSRSCSCMCVLGHHEACISCCEPWSEVQSQ